MSVKDDGLCAVCGSEDVARIVTGEANANFIAAAPELYAVLEELVGAHRKVVHGEATHVPAHILNAAEATLAKARGES